MMSITAATRRSSILVLQRTYVSRAHPKPRPTFSVHQAVEDVLEGIEARIQKREVNWVKRAEQRAKKGIKEDGPYRNQDETIEIAMNLNLDPRKPGQNIRGAVVLPNGTGKDVKVAVFTASASAAELALEKGACLAGGESLVDQIVAGTVSVDSFDRTVASQDIMGYLSKNLARTLGPRGLMPNAKVGTLVNNVDDIQDVLSQELAGQAQFRTEKAGIVHVGVGKGSFGKEKILENIKAVVQTVHEMKPEAYGKGKKPSARAQYVLKAYLSSTQGKGVKLDLRTIDPSSTHFMSDSKRDEASAA